MTDRQRNTDTTPVVGWCLIPPWVMADEQLSVSEKALYGRILGSVNAHGYCSADGAQLGEQMNLSREAAIECLKVLEDRGYIQKFYQRDKYGVIFRVLYPEVL